MTFILLIAHFPGAEPEGGRESGPPSLENHKSLYVSLKKNWYSSSLAETGPNPLEKQLDPASRRRSVYDSLWNMLMTKKDPHVRIQRGDRGSGPSPPP